MKFWIVPVVAIAAVGVGCQANKKAPEANSSVIDVAAARAPATPAPPPVYLPPAQDVAVTETPAAGAPAAGQTYVVKKGDTLYGIARQVYGDGKQWQKIAAANPGVSPSTLKVGQKLTLP